MKELSERSGVPRTTIHYYLREGLLPPPHKPNRNSAVYSEAHLGRLALLRELRGAPQGGYPMASLRRIVGWVDQGVEPELAVELERSLVGESGGDMGDLGTVDLDELAARAEVAPELARGLLDAGLLIDLPGRQRGRFDATDARMLKAYARLVETTGLTPVDGAPIAAAIRQIGRYEMELRNQAIEDLDPNRAAAVSRAIQDGANLIHTYLFGRGRLHDIAEQTLTGGASDTAPFAGPA